ncbi:MAG: class I SAM-dependent methyltransferase [Sphingomonas sp.]|nr:class I SAM-dependent methyltransferase [Sphingomonas sp.]
MDAIIALGGSKLGRVLDVGAGDGVVSAEIDRRNLASAIVAAEISASGIDKMRSRTFSSPFEIKQIDGYTLPFSDAEFDTAVCAHVIEHVEHERLFLKEISRVAKQLYLIAPLEGGLRGRIDRRMGHINYYTPMSLRNLVETSGFTVDGVRVFGASTERERIISGGLKGSIKNSIRRAVTLVAGPYAPHVMAHVMALHAVPDAR